MLNIEEFKYLWEPDRLNHKYVLLYTKDDKIPTFHHPYYHMMAVIDIDIDTIKDIAVKMLEEGAEVFTSFDELYEKYPRISNSERRRRIDEGNNEKPKTT